MIIKHFGKLSGRISVIKTINQYCYTVADEKRVAELMNKYFINITKNLNLKVLIINTTDDIQSLAKDYDNHISIRKIKEAYPEIVPDSFHFKSMSLDDAKKRSLKYKSEKAFHIWDHSGNSS